MKLSTKSLSSLLLTTGSMMASMSRKARDTHRRHREERLERILQRHDRKGELRADLLGLSPIEFRYMQKKSSFEEIVRSRGFRNTYEFQRALFGKLREELIQRGWTRQKIDRFVIARSARLN